MRWNLLISAQLSKFKTSDCVSSLGCRGHFTLNTKLREENHQRRRVVDLKTLLIYIMHVTFNKLFCENS